MHIDCPFRLAAELIQRPANRIWLNKQSVRLVWARMYGHLLYGMTQVDPLSYYAQFNIQLEHNLAKRVSDWNQYRWKQKNYQKLIINKPDESENRIITHFFPDDVNIDWVYQEDNIFVNILEHKIYNGVYVDRMKNRRAEFYSKTEKNQYITYHLMNNSKEQGQKFNYYKVEFISNRFLQFDGLIKDDYQRHVLQIEQPVCFRLVDQFKHFYITDIDDCLKGNPHLIQ